MRGGVDQPALARDADRRERVVARDHPAREVRRAQRLDRGCRARFQLVLEDDQPKELQIRFRLLSITPPILADRSSHEPKITYRLSFCAFSQERPSMLLPAIAMTRYPRFV